MSGSVSKRYNAGESVEDLCRVCKNARRHTVVVVDAEGRILRVICDYCGSQHNFRGGESVAAPSLPAAVSRVTGGHTPELVSESEGCP